MLRFSHVREFIEGYVDNIAEVLGLDVTILDEDGIRICGTGAYRDLVGEPVPKGSFFEKILMTGKPGIIFESKKDETYCSYCKFIDRCTEMATIGFPIFKRNRTVGVIGIIGFTAQQKEIILNNSNKLINFLSHMSTLLEYKLLTYDDLGLEMDRSCQVQESVKPPVNYTFANIIGNHPSLQNVIQRAKKVLNSPSTVLITGESGTGKELLAQSLHYESKRSKYPFVTINCGAIPEHLLESELFGYEGGSFTGSKREGSIGKFELAHQGTIFLDEIGDLPLPLQPKLLRVLQERKIDRIGGRKPIPIDVRVIAATNKNLEEMVRRGTFREDLFYRLHVIPLLMPALRERKEDIIVYVRYFIHKYNQLLGKGIFGIDEELEKWMICYNWPGNIRQLENVVEYMMNIAETPILSRNDLPSYGLMGSEHSKDLQDFDEGKGLEEHLAQYEQQILQNYLLRDEYRGDKRKMAQELQISLATLYRKLEKYGLV